MCRARSLPCSSLFSLVHTAADMAGLSQRLQRLSINPGGGQTNKRSPEILAGQGTLVKSAAPSRRPATTRPSDPPLPRSRGGARGKAAEMCSLPSRRGPLDRLPQDILIHLFAAISSPQDISACAQVCKAWRAAAEADVLWKQLYEQRWGRQIGTLDAGSSAEAKQLQTARTAKEHYRECLQKSRRICLKAVLQRWAKTGLARTWAMQSSPGHHQPPARPAGSRRPAPPPRSTLPRGEGALRAPPGRPSQEPPGRPSQEPPGRPSQEPPLQLDVAPALKTQHTPEGLGVGVVVPARMSLPGWHHSRERASAAAGRPSSTAGHAGELHVGLATPCIVALGSGENEAWLGGNTGWEKPKQAAAVLKLAFSMRINRGGPWHSLHHWLRERRGDEREKWEDGSLVQSPKQLSMFPASLSLRCPEDVLNGLEMAGLTALEVVASSTVLDRRFLVLCLKFTMSSWKLVKDAPADDALRLFQTDTPPGGGSVLLGTFKGSSGPRPNRSEPLGLLQVNLCTVDILRSAVGAPLDLLAHHLPVLDDIDSLYGLHDFHVAVTLRSHARLLWNQDFTQVHCSKALSDSGRAVFSLVGTGEARSLPPAFNGVPKLAYKTAAFSGVIPGRALTQYLAPLTLPLGLS
ncbi:hypothetical protein CYMTET_24424 [Cymbomonas tetramitiformis]|uniref:F-box domain-containing protein n=1 Tax=Cymbomonas tetramitiformis TaxID=36881 RepID=A0AAE0L093_9CHLO|nr:hypothetical protein CYMTET_24424 [Cymbomonas tetramitiformis]